MVGYALTYTWFNRTWQKVKTAIDSMISEPFKRI
jgi:hypothetical protein